MLLPTNRTVHVLQWGPGRRHCRAFPTPTTSGSAPRSRSFSLFLDMESRYKGRGRQACPQVMRFVTRGQSLWAGSTCGSRPLRWAASRAKELRSALAFELVCTQGSAPCRRPKPPQFPRMRPQWSQVLAPSCPAQSVIDVHGRHSPFSLMQ